MPALSLYCFPLRLPPSDLVRVQYSSDRNEEGERGIKEWIALSSLRPVPPESPDGWLLRLQMYDIIQARQGSCWADTIYYETKLPVTEESEVRRAAPEKAATE